MKTYTRQTGEAVGHAPRWMIGFAVIVVLCGLLFARLPGSFLPEEDQGYALALVQLPPGAAIDRTIKVMSQVNGILKQNPAVQYVFQVSGFSFIGQGDNVGLAFIRLKPWDARKTNATEFIKQANGALFMGLKDAQAFVVNLPTVNGLSQFGGFDMYLQDRAGAGHSCTRAGAEPAARQGGAEPKPRRRASQRAAGFAGTAARARSRAGAVDGLHGERCIHARSS